MPRKKVKPARKPRVHKNLTGLEVSIDSFGEIKSTMDIEKINAFLDENVEDKKLIEQREHDLQKKKKSQGKK
ncbi:MAG: hypothetical protein JNN04_07130 [Cyclobacteriaceae bacterium]|nr:hypothetical protein [Cyclobacteriaceae bacterium]